MKAREIVMCLKRGEKIFFPSPLAVRVCGLYKRGPL